ncbi:MAG: 3-oxoacyl-[acyl-carrier-protein] reductase [Gemmatimonadetes bacterium]|nr:MAG: 3-oxoacyl-[acyl-carrier-protein] reductase [Gemmatimonadota bacterium]
MRLQDKIALVTGASRGIGKAIALTLAGEGAHLVIGSRTEGACAAVATEIEAMGRQALPVAVDVRDSESVDNMIQQAKETFGRIDILVNNAGITKDTLLMRMKPEDWQQVIDINLTGTFNCTKAVTRLMMKQRYGRIINITSVVGLMGNAGQSNYVASKAGVIGFTKSVAKELASRNITVNAVAPGFIETDMTANLPDEVKASYLQQIPLGRMGTGEDVAKVVLFLASEDADYLTGQTLSVDGGMHM